MKRLLFSALALVVFAVMLAPAGCSKGTEPATGTETPLELMLRAVVPESLTTIMYDDIAVVSTYNGRAVPAFSASQDEKNAWWQAIQSKMLFSFPAPVFADFWGFDATQITGSLTAWSDLVDSTASLTMVYGTPDTKGFGDKLSSYGYVKETYRGHTLYTGTPDTGDTGADAMLGGAYGVITPVTSGDRPTSIILMTSTGNQDLAATRQAVQNAIDAYVDKTAVGYTDTPLSVMARSIGKVGNAFILDGTSYLSYSAALRTQVEDVVARAVGPGNLDNFRDMAITYHEDAAGSYLDFILEFDTADLAAANRDVLNERLSGGRKIIPEPDRPTSVYWSVVSVTADGPTLTGTVRLTDALLQRDAFLNEMVYTLDFWFLHPGLFN